MSSWFTSDPHFGHPFLAKYRGFSSVYEMDETIVRTWNALVDTSDDVYILGDLYDHNPLWRLNGRLHLVVGNHDEDSHGRLKMNTHNKTRFEWIKSAATVSFPDEDAQSRHRGKDGIPRQYMYLHHYACRVWKYSHYGSWHLYGHSHGNLADDPNARSMDVGLDAVLKITGGVYRPISYDEVKDTMKAKNFKPVDHHGRRH